MGRLESSGRLPAPTWLGSYDRLAADMTINAFRLPETYGKPFAAGMTNVLEAGRDLSEAMQRSLYHELGHDVLGTAGPEAEHQVGRLLRSGRAFPSSGTADRRVLGFTCGQRPRRAPCGRDDSKADCQGLSDSPKQREGRLNAIGRELDDLSLSGRLDFDAFKSLFLQVWKPPAMTRTTLRCSSR